MLQDAAAIHLLSSIQNMHPVLEFRLYLDLQLAVKDMSAGHR